MNPPDETTRLVPELKNFPFPDLPSFMREYNSDRRVRLSVDRQTALQWSTRGGSTVHVPGGLRGTVQFWMFAPYLAVAGYIVYLIATRQWWFLLALPAFVLAFFAYQPSSAMILGPLRIAAIAAAIIGLVVSVVFRGRGFTAAFAVLIVEWLSYKIMYSVSVSAFLRAVAKHEELFERCWNGGLIGIWLPDGTRHWSDRKYESGQFVRLDQ